MFNQSGFVLLQHTLITGAAVSSVTFPNLDGDTHRIYRLAYQVKNPTGGIVGYRFLPNGLAPNGPPFVDITGGAPSGGTAGLAGEIASLVAGERAFGNMDYYAATGGRRYGTCAMCRPGDGVIYVHQWNDTTTNITSLVVDSNGVLGGIGVGSEFFLFYVASTP
jgi:hypothetical protein